MRFRERVVKELFGSASRCAYPGCWEQLVVEDRGVSTINVDIAHIRSWSRSGPRHDVDYPVEWIDEARNLLLLCMKHHRIVDGADSTYTVAELERWKRDSVAGGIGGTFPDDRIEESIHFFEGFAHRIASDPEFGRWRPDTGKVRTRSPQGAAAEFTFVANDPVSVSAAWSVAQLIDGFAPGAILHPEPASAFGASVAAFLLDDESGFATRRDHLERCCRVDPFEAMLTSFAFAVTAVRLWETVTSHPAALLRDSWVATGLTIPYLADIVMAARYEKSDYDPTGNPTLWSRSFRTYSSASNEYLHRPCARRNDNPRAVWSSSSVARQRSHVGMSGARDARSAAEECAPVSLTTPR